MFAHEDKLIFVPFKPHTECMKGWYPTGGRNGNTTGGSVLVYRKPTRLAISRPALDLMRRIKRNHDDCGDLTWDKCSDSRIAFSYWGSVHRVMHVKSSEVARDFQILEDYCTIVPNKPPPEAIAFIRDHPKEHHWKEPHTITYDGPDIPDDR